MVAAALATVVDAREGQEVVVEEGGVVGVGMIVVIVATAIIGRPFHWDRRLSVVEVVAFAVFAATSHGHGLVLLVVVVVVVVVG